MNEPIHKTLAELAELLEAKCVPYAIIGGIALLVDTKRLFRFWVRAALFSHEPEARVLKLREVFSPEKHTY